MNLASLEVLRCPYCGGRLQLEQCSSLGMREGEVWSGILYCGCCAYPIAGGIPYMQTGAAAEAALTLLGEGEPEGALLSLLGLEGTRRQDFCRLLNDEGAMTFRNALEILSQDAEGMYLLYRFSDPTFLVSDSVVRAVGEGLPGRALDLCGGAGHLTRSLCSREGVAEVWLADIAFWKIWLATQFVAPGCYPVCCDANGPLPFARETFSLVLCSDAMNYVWTRRLLACEMVRLVGSAGVLVVTHIHNALCYNPSEGMPLEPGGYRHLFEGVTSRLFQESDVLDAVIGAMPLDLSAGCSDSELSEEPALILVAAQQEESFRVYAAPVTRAPRQPAINPLYVVEHQGEKRLLRLRFPSEYYEEEFAACKRYLPQTVELDATQLKRVEVGELDGELSELAERYVLLNLPPRYL